MASFRGAKRSRPSSIVVTKAAVLEPEDPLGKLTHAVVVRNDDDCLVKFQCLLAQEFHDFVSALGVEVGCRFVGQDQVRVPGERSHDCYSLLLAVAQPLGQRVNAVAEAKCLEKMRGSLRGVRSSIARTVLNDYTDVLECSEGFEEVEALIDETHLLPPDRGEVGFVHVCDLCAADMHTSLSWPEQRTSDGQKGRLAGTRRAHDGNDLAPANVERHILKGGDAEVAGAINLADALQLKDQRWRALHGATL